jgi:flagellar protein FliO/FliZ
MAAAADAARQGLPATGAPIGSVLLSLVLVIALIVALAWALRRLQSGRAGGSRFMHVIAQVPLGPRERVVLVRVGEYQALLGVSPGGVTSLRLLDVEVSTTAPPPAQAGSDATALLARMRDLIERSRGR